MNFTLLGTALARSLVAIEGLRKSRNEAQRQLDDCHRWLELLEKDLKIAQDETAKITASATPEPFHKLGDRYIAERDVQAAVASGIQTATQELIAKLAAQQAPKKARP